MGKKKNSKIAIVIDGKDICRIIPFNPESGIYELKIDFLENDYDITIYKLFNVEPIKWNLNEPSHQEITYHKGTNKQPLRIHLKNKLNHTYETLPLEKIKPPDMNSLFPLPIVKLEVPTNTLETKFVSKGYHKVVNPEECNVIEIYMVNSNFDWDFFEEKLPGIFEAFLMLSFEYYATNTVVTGKQKYRNFIDKEKSTNGMSSIKIFDDMQIISIHYRDPSLDKKHSKINVTFIENELSDAILGMTQIRYPPYSRNRWFDFTYLGGATLKDVNQPILLDNRHTIGENNVIADSLRRNQLTTEERNKVFWHGLKLRIKLRDALIEWLNKKPSISL